MFYFEISVFYATIDISGEKMETKEQKQKFQQIVDESHRIVFFGGAGVSTESGIPDFRSVDGLYNQEWDYAPEEILSKTFFFENTPEFYRFYRKKMLVTGIKPNAAHLKLAELERAGKLTAVVTQNIDGLHQAAGSTNVLELHGSVLRNTCTSCAKKFGLDYILSHSDENLVPRCDECGAVIKPDVVLYEEALDTNTVNAAIDAISKADTLIIGGTSLSVYPAAGLVNYFRGTKLVLINRDAGAFDSNADLAIHDSIGKVLGAVSVQAAGTKRDK